MNQSTSTQSKSVAPRSSGAKTATAAATSKAEPQEINVVKANLDVSAATHPAREQLIAEAAYHRAESRSFEPGHEIDDWLAAEAEVDARLQGEGRAY